MPELTKHPLDGTFAYFDSQLEIIVLPETTYQQHGITYRGQFDFTGRYSVELSSGERYYWPIRGGTINTLQINPGHPDVGYEISFVMFSPAVSSDDPTFGSVDLSRFMDSWTGYAGVDKDGNVNMLQLRFGNVTYNPVLPPSKDGPQPPIRTAWSAFSWQPTWDDFGARGYIRIPGS